MPTESRWLKRIGQCPHLPRTLAELCLRKRRWAFRPGGHLSHPGSLEPLPLPMSDGISHGNFHSRSLPTVFTPNQPRTCLPLRFLRLPFVTRIDMVGSITRHVTENVKTAKSAREEGTGPRPLPFTGAMLAYSGESLPAGTPDGDRTAPTPDRFGLQKTIHARCCDRDGAGSTGVENSMTSTPIRETSL